MKKTVSIIISIALILAMLIPLSTFAATEVIVSITDSGSKQNPGFVEVSGDNWYGSTNSTLGIHYIDPGTNKQMENVRNSIEISNT